MRIALERCRQRRRIHYPHGRVEELVQPFAGRSRDEMGVDLAPLQLLAQRLRPLTGFGNVDLVRGDDLRLAAQRRVEQLQLAVDRVEVGGQVAILRSVDQMDDRPAPRHVLEKAVAEPGAAMRPLDEPRQIGEDKAAAIPVLHDAEVGLQRRERIVGDLRLRAREPRDQSALAGVGKAHHPHVREQPQLEADPLLLALGPWLRETRRLQRRGGEVHVSQAAPSAFREHPTAPVLAQIGQDFRGVGITHQRSRRHFQHQLRRGVAVLVAAATRLAVLRPVLPLEAEVEQRRQSLVGLEDDVAAVPPVAARRTAARDELLPPEGDGPGATVARLHEDFRFVDELHGDPAPAP